MEFAGVEADPVRPSSYEPWPAQPQRQLKYISHRIQSELFDAQLSSAFLMGRDRPIAPLNFDMTIEVITWSIPSLSPVIPSRIRPRLEVVPRDS